MALLPASSYFRLKFELTHVAGLRKEGSALQLDFPKGAEVAFLDEQMQLKDHIALKMAWNESGIGIEVTVLGREEDPIYKPQSLLQSEYIDVYFDTRNSKGNHRANQFCHCYRLIPHQSTSGRSSKRKTYTPAVEAVEIGRASKSPPPNLHAAVECQSQPHSGGYQILVWFPAESLHGFSPEDQPEIGFHFELHDSLLGVHSLAADLKMPFENDPSLWHTLALSR